jgi:hypothetical protein
MVPRVARQSEHGDSPGHDCRGAYDCHRRRRLGLTLDQTFDRKQKGGVQSRPPKPAEDNCVFRGGSLDASAFNRPSLATCCPHPQE